MTSKYLDHRPEPLLQLALVGMSPFAPAGPRWTLAQLFLLPPTVSLDAALESSCIELSSSFVPTFCPLRRARSPVTSQAS